VNRRSFFKALAWTAAAVGLGRIVRADDPPPPIRDVLSLPPSVIEFERGTLTANGSTYQATQIKLVIQQPTVEKLPDGRYRVGSDGLVTLTVGRLDHRPGPPPRGLINTLPDRIAVADENDTVHILLTRVNRTEARYDEGYFTFEARAAAAQLSWNAGLVYNHPTPPDSEVTDEPS
jgi:hypothetical protein